MTSILDIPDGNWWRFDRYEVRDGYIRPTQGAALEAYGPWAVYADAKASPGLRDRAGANRAVETPYGSLINATASATRAKRGEFFTWGFDDESDEHRLLEWVERFGLLGILPHSAEAVVLPIPVGPDGSLGLIRRYDRLPDGSWEERLSEPEPDSTVGAYSVSSEVEGGRVLSPECCSAFEGHWPDFYRPGVYMRAPLRAVDDPYLALSGDEGSEFQAMRLLPFSQYWGRFFPDVPYEAKDSTFYPRPLTEEFWRSYAEPLGQVIGWAKALELAIDLMGSDTGRIILHNIVWPVTPSVVNKEDGGLEREWSSPSLIASLGMMAVLSQTEGLRARHCECGNFFESGAYQAEYCSTKCRHRYQRQSYRRKAREAVSLAAQGLGNREIAAAMGTDAEAIAGLLESSDGQRLAAREHRGRRAAEAQRESEEGGADD